MQFIIKACAWGAEETMMCSCRKWIGSDFTVRNIQVVTTQLVEYAGHFKKFFEKLDKNLI